MNLNQFRIKTKLFLLLGVMTAVTVSVAGLGVLRLTGINASLVDVDDVGDVQLLGARMNQNLIVMNRSEYRMAADPSAGTVNAAAEVNLNNRKQFEERLEKSRNGAAADEIKMLDKIKAQYDSYVAGSDKIIAFARGEGAQVSLSGVQQDLNEKVKTNRAQADILQGIVKDYVDYLDKKAQSISDGAKAEGHAAIVTMAVVAGGGTLLGLIIGYVLATVGISLPLNRSVEELNKLAAGDLAVTVTGTDRADECGDVAKGLEVFKQNALRARELEAEAAAQKERAEQDRKRMMRALADEFEAAVGGVVTTVSAASSQLESAAQSLTKTAEETQHRSNVVASASEQTSVNVQGVAAASEQLASTVQEIGRQVQQSNLIAGEAVGQADKTKDSIQDLSQSADRIGDVVGLINSIASQTNLLALNATIEAARAGDAGKGFAVVAQEVKALASQTSKATNEIASQISAMQEATKNAVVAIHEIATTIGKISEVSTTIAAAVEEQSATTQEISRNVLEAAKGTSEVASSIVEVNSGAGKTGAASSQVLSSAKELTSESVNLRTAVEKFLQNVRAA